MTRGGPPTRSWPGRIAARILGIAGLRRGRLDRVVEELQHVPPAPGESIVRGTLHLVAPEIASQPALRPAGAGADERDCAAWIETADGEVVFDGVVELVPGGTRWSWRRSPAVRRAERRTVPMSAGDVAALHGAEVVARGRLTKEPGRGTGYRGGDVLRVLRPLDRVIRIAATAAPSNAHVLDRRADRGPPIEPG